MDRTCKRGHLRKIDNLFKDGHCRECRQVRREELLKMPSFCPKGHLRAYETVYKNGGCRICAREYLQRPDIKIKHARRTRNTGLKKRFGITEEQYNVLFDQQNGKCFLCGIHQSLLTRRLAIDHSHQTGEIRALLCSACNTGLGLFKEDIHLMEKAIKYLTEKIYVR